MIWSLILTVLKNKIFDKNIGESLSNLVSASNAERGQKKINFFLFKHGMIVFVPTTENVAQKNIIWFLRLHIQSVRKSNI